MQKALLLFFLTFLNSNIFSQEIDPTKLAVKVMQSNLKDQEKVDSLNQIAVKTYATNAAATLKILEVNKKLATQIKYENGLGKTWYLQSRIEEKFGNIDQSRKFNEKAISLIKDSSSLATAYIFQCWIYRRLSLKEKSIEYGIKGIKIAEALNDYSIMGNAYNSVAALYVEYDLKKAREYQLLALKYRRLSKNKSKIAASLGNLGIILFREKKYNESIAYHLQSLALFKEVKDTSEIAFVYNDLGATYAEKGDTERGIKYLKESIRLREEMNESNELAYTYNYLGEAYQRAGNFKEAEKWIKKALAFAIQIHNTKQNYEALESLAKFYASNGKMDVAYQYLNSYKQFGDSLKKIDRAVAIDELTTKYETEKKEQKIVLLSKDKEVQQLELQSKNFLLVLALFMVLVIVLISWFMIHKRKTNEKFTLQQEVIRQQDIATKAVLDAEEKERRRISSDLHDGIGQMLSASLLNLNGFYSSVKDKLSPDEELKATNSISLLNDSYDEMRSVSHQMMPNALLKSGLSTAVREFLNKIESEQLKVILDINGLKERLEEQTETVMYRIIQECVNNIIKHAKASQITIQMSNEEEGITCTIEDNGKGFDPNIKTQGIGMSNINSRISFLKGFIEIDTAMGKGTLVHIFIPARV